MPGDESDKKLDLRAAHGVDELLIVDPRQKTMSWTGLDRGEYRHLKRGRLIELGAAELAEEIDWPYMAGERPRTTMTREADRTCQGRPRTIECDGLHRAISAHTRRARRAASR